MSVCTILSHRMPITESLKRNAVRRGNLVHAVFSIQEEVFSREPMNNAGKLALLYSVVNGF